MANAFNLGGDGDYVPLAGSRARGLPTTSIRGVQGGRPAINRVRTLSVDFTDDNLFGGILRSQFFIQDFESVFGGSISATLQDPAIAPIGTLFDQSSNNSDKIGAKLSYARQDIAGLGLEVVAGVDLLRDKTFQELVLTNRLWVPETVFRDAAPFIQVEQTLFDERLRLSGGVRYEIAGLKVDDFRTLAFYGAPLVRGGSPSFEESLFNVGAVFNATDAITAYASFSDGFTMPDVGRILREINRPGVAVESFLNLQPVLADNIEVGTTYATDGVNVELSYFWSSSALGQRLVPDGDGIFRVTREKTKIHGFEGSVRVNATDALSLGANYAHLNGRFDSNGDGRLDSDLGGVNISPNRLNVFADWAIADAWSGRVQLAHLFDRTFVGPGAPVTFEGYTTVDASVGWTSEEIGRIDVAVQNLLNRDYITYFSQTNNLTDNLRYFAGRGRTITLRYANSF
jgi:iron complex outermembrane receptor protein